MSPRRPKSELVNELVSEFRISGNQDSAFDNLAAERLGMNRTDLHCLNIIENSGGLTAGELAAEGRSNPKILFECRQDLGTAEGRLGCGPRGRLHRRGTRTDHRVPPGDQ